MGMGAQKISGWVNKSIFIDLELSPIFALLSFFSRFSHSLLIIPQKNNTIWEFYCMAKFRGMLDSLFSYPTDQLNCYKANACLPIHTLFSAPFVLYVLIIQKLKYLK